MLNRNFKHVFKYKSFLSQNIYRNFIATPKLLSKYRKK